LNSKLQNTYIAIFYIIALFITIYDSNFLSSRRYCWVCFATEEDDITAAWVKPCHCRGTTKWVHQGCIQRWVDEKQKGHASHTVTCPQCNTEYIIVYPNMGECIN
jgi:E3 ubiquitin-protein ligase MARCH5